MNSDPSLPELPPEPPPEKRPSGLHSGSVQDLGRVWAVGAEFAATVGAAALIGYLFDYFLGTTPWGMVVWVVMGLLSGFIRLVREAGRLNREAGRKAQNRRSDPR